MITIPSVIWTDGNGNERAVDLGTRLLRDRIVLCTGEVTDELAESVGFKNGTGRRMET